jgi:predicted MFS family arabinose efflux permease
VRQGLVHDIVGDERLQAAVGLSMTVMSMGGAVGPAAAALVIGTLGVGACFLLNAATFTAVLAAMLLMRTGELQVRETPAARQPRQVRAGLRYVASHPDLAAPVVLLFLFGLAWQEEVLLPLLARYTFDSSASLFGVLATTVAIGAVAGGVVTTSGRPPSERVIVRSALAFAASVVGVALAPIAAVAVVLLLVTGAAAVILVVQLNSILQLRVASEYRGRVMALYVLCMYGTRPLGAPVLGWIGSTTSPRVALLVAPALVTSVGLPIWSWLQPRGSASLEPLAPASP